MTAISRVKQIFVKVAGPATLQPSCIQGVLSGAKGPVLQTLETIQYMPYALSITTAAAILLPSNAALQQMLLFNNSNAAAYRV